jgi:hypothetical protein
VPPVTHTHALFADQSQSILDDLAALRIGLFGPVAVICGGHIGIKMLAPFCDCSSLHLECRGLRLTVGVYAVPDETGLVSLMSAATEIAVIRWFAQQRQGCVDTGRSPDCSADHEARLLKATTTADRGVDQKAGIRAGLMAC